MKMYKKQIEIRILSEKHSEIFQPAITWSKLITETLEKGVKYVQS